MPGLATMPGAARRKHLLSRHHVLGSGLLRMSRSRIDLYWTSIETAPPDVALQVRVSDGSSDYLLPYPCKLMPAGWVNAATGSPLAVRATYWKLFVETVPRSKATRRKTAPAPPSRDDGRAGGCAPGTALSWSLTGVQRHAATAASHSRSESRSTASA